MGPTLIIYLPCNLAVQEINELDRYLSETTEKRKRDGNEWEFWINLQTCCCLLDVYPCEHIVEKHERVAIEKLVGYLPVESLQLDNMCRNDPEGHKLLALMAADLARKFSSVIYVGDPSCALETESRNTGRCFVLKKRQYFIDADMMQIWVGRQDFRLEI